MHPLIKRFKDETDWRDKCLLLEIIHIKLRQTKRYWRIKDTARALKLSVGLVSEDLQLARALANELIDRDITSRNKAIKLMKEKQS